MGGEDDAGWSDGEVVLRSSVQDAHHAALAAVGDGGGGGTSAAAAIAGLLASAPPAAHATSTAYVAATAAATAPGVASGAGSDLTVAVLDGYISRVAGDATVDDSVAEHAAATPSTAAATTVADEPAAAPPQVRSRSRRDRGRSESPMVGDHSSRVVVRKGRHRRRTTLNYSLATPLRPAPSFRRSVAPRRLPLRGLCPLLAVTAPSSGPRQPHPSTSAARSAARPVNLSGSMTGRGSGCSGSGRQMQRLWT